MSVTRGLAQKFGRVLGFGAGHIAGGGAGPDAAGLRRGDLSQAVLPAGLQPANGAAGAVAQSAQTAEFGGKHVLVADDSEINRTILRTFLERLGFEVTLAADGVEAVDRWQPEHDLVCLDIEMPRLDGMHAFLHIKDEASRRGLPVPMALAVTVNALTHEVTAYLHAGFDACLPKPFSRGDLVELLRRRWPAPV
ncbi:response regulator [Paragemmobacter straminiformis]|uniref:histidine kinase n=1 Tax=Paragemmobacter straminiformis TaxID=2045119 RepID=A0A842IEZ2_9RHOB|nr:response regulator [Gemmobacter straminiformis]MBC2837444.1 response regulator [Gemmobacter straminiformis]